MTKTPTDSPAANPSPNPIVEKPEQAAAPGIVPTKKKKRKYTRGLKGIQKAERRASKAANRLASSVASGIATYRKRRDQSAGKRRDGALIDVVPNLARGLGKSIRKASLVPYDLAKTFNTKSRRRRLRRFVRLVTPG